MYKSVSIKGGCCDHHEYELLCCLQIHCAYDFSITVVNILVMQCRRKCFQGGGGGGGHRRQCDFGSSTRSGSYQQLWPQSFP